MVKKIHYCWFGGSKLPKSVKKCIATWKKWLPDYEIIEWNESNFDINTCNFVKEAYENKKWAFVSDYARIQALYKEGGIYFDTDVKVIKDISHITDKDVFFGYEDSGYIGTAVMGVKEKENKYMKEVLDYYNKIEHFIPEIMYNYANPVIITKIIKKYENHIDENGIHIFDNNIYIYPREYFFPINYNYSEKVYTKNTCMVHLFNATWTDIGERRTIKIYRKFGPELGKIINKFIDKCFDIKNKLLNLVKKAYNFARMTYSIYLRRTKRVQKVKEKLEKTNNNYIVIKHPEGLEFNSGINELFDNDIIEIRDMHTRKEAKMIAKTIVNANKSIVIFNFIFDGWDEIISELKKLKKDIVIKVLIHGGETIYEKSYIWDKQNKLLDMYNKNQIDEFGFFKKSLYEFYKEKGYNAKLLKKKVQIKNKEVYNTNKNANGYIKIGMYEAYDGLIKNPYNQLSAISLLKNVKLDYSPINYKVSMVARKFNINLSGTLKMPAKLELYKKIAGNNINLYITMVDESEILPLESLELGTVCLVGSNYEIFDGSELEKYIVVNKEDNIIEIFNKIKFAIKNEETILKYYNEWKKEYLKDAEESFNNFIS